LAEAEAAVKAGSLDLVARLLVLDLAPVGSLVAVVANGVAVAVAAVSGPPVQAKVGRPYRRQV